MQPLDPEVRLLLTARIATAYMGRHAVAQDQITPLIGSIHGALATAGEEVKPPAPPVPAVPVKKSITYDRIVCLDCGEKLKTLRRHLRTCHGMEQDEYRAKWKLPHDYPLTAPAYSENRAELARASGLGKRAPKAKTRKVR